MKLTKQPLTELEYWEAIESLGGFIWSTEHGISRGHIDYPNPLIDRDLREAFEIQKKLVFELSQKFGVITPYDYPKVEDGQELPPAPEGKIYYWDWYHKVECEYSLIEYQKLPCSACPFSKGFELFIPSHKVSCGFYPDDNNEFKSHHIYSCGIVTFSMSYYDKQISIEDIYDRILKDYGQEALDVFKKKELEIGSLPDKQRRAI